MEAALLLGADHMVRPWEFDAIRHAVDSGMKITTVLHCTNDRRPPLRARNAAYYALAFAGRRGASMRKRVDVTSLLPHDVRIIRFASEWEGTWQRIPDHVAGQLADVDVVVKFGMGLLRDPERIPSTYGVISYHHGDPETPRGRPAGFYELGDGSPVMGIIVQQLTNTLDAGLILAKAYSRVVPTSYKATLHNAMTIGTPLLAHALETLRSSDALETMTVRPNRGLPSNRHVLRALMTMTTARIGRLLYGGLKEKRWNIAYMPQKFDPEGTEVPHYDDLEPLELPEGYTFAAAPGAHHNGRLYVEVMHAGTGKGEIFAYDDGTWRPVEVPVDGGHLTYPQIVEDDGATYLFPEMADVGAPSLFELDEDELKCGAPQPLAGLEDERLIDGTLLDHEGHWYLFGSRPETANERLELWVADDLRGPWRRHPSSPVCLDPRGARMGGPIVHARGRMYRIGQNGSVGYGQGTTINRIEKLTPDAYREVSVSPFVLKGAHGPHTVLTNNNGYWLDYYTETTTPMAGVRRLRGLMNSSRGHSNSLDNMI